jgi:hypothetical protein
MHFGHNGEKKCSCQKLTLATQSMVTGKLPQLSTVSNTTFFYPILHTVTSPLQNKHKNRSAGVP